MTATDVADNVTQSMRSALLGWYDEHQRDLPWRRTRDPYAIWVSEVMLQQTRVDTVLRYYGRFLERFPTTEHLARATEDEVLAAWSGLGYYRRARMLHAGVREVVARYGGAVPEDADARRGLAGVGRYTAGAIGSIAFDRPEPIVDGNVARVLSRVFAIATPLGRADTERDLWQHATELVQGARPGALNQGLMELGALLCSPTGPDCSRCPVARWCEGRIQARLDELPVARERAAPKQVDLAAVVVTDAQQRLWLSRQGDGGLFAGLWAVPTTEGRGRAAARTVLTRHGVVGTLSARALSDVAHQLTHRSLRVQVWRLSDASGEPPEGLRAVPLQELTSLGISRLTTKLLSVTDVGACRPPVAP